MRLSDLADLVAAALESLGLSVTEQQIVSRVLLWAELRGNSQGLEKIVAKAVAPDPGAGDIVVTQRSRVVTQIEGNRNLGMVVLERAVDEAIRAAEANGVGIAATRGTTTSTGAIGYYAERAAERGLLCIIIGGTPKAVAPFGSAEAIFGTNPLSFAAPTRNGPLLIDMSTSAVTWFGLLQAERSGESIAEGLAFDSSGADTKDPGAAMRGAIRAFGGAKGSALALLIELLTGPLAGGAIAGDDEHQSGNVIIALDPNVFGFGAGFSDRAATLVERIRRSRTAPEADQVQIPGERSHSTFAAAQREDRVRLPAGLVAAIQAIATK